MITSREATRQPDNNLQSSSLVTDDSSQRKLLFSTVEPIQHQLFSRSDILEHKKLFTRSNICIVLFVTGLSLSKHRLSDRLISIKWYDNLLFYRILYFTCLQSSSYQSIWSKTLFQKTIIFSCSTSKCSSPRSEIQ